ncbi:MAG: hypothetical protein JWQ91_118 [Aeromicrobium sp.]|jgi:sporulation protein YlmC with PRC-barrel domain|uniref:PRC-barrel domain-containing protein n=1 Tax=Aeromicrobium sp. TaxID=1871063 RepID=UPI002612D5F3|nr:PRC-barrel domain-containing protein [Aeromicrobium sp.]MCW2823201.1 hypothetical protein [Aeromicrobium sp.]
MTRPEPSGTVVLLLSRVVGLPVLSSDGTRVGRVVDLTVQLPAATPVVHHVAVGDHGGARHLVPWSVVGRATDRDLRLAIAGPEVAAHELPGSAHLPDVVADHELLLGRDVLDSQVVDLTGRRLTRVSEVLLAPRGDGGLEVLGLDLGLGALLARVGLGILGRRMDEVVVRWSDVYVASSRGHQVQMSVPADHLRRLDPGDLAEIVARLRTEHATDVLRAVAPAHAATALAASHDQLRHRLLRSLPSADAAAVVEAGPEWLARDLARPVPALRRRRFRRTSGWRAHRPGAGEP